MWTSLYIRFLVACVLVVAAGSLSNRAMGQALPEDPVEDLRQALRQEDVRIPNEFQIEFRKRNLAAKVKALRTISDLRRALALDEWKEEPGQGRSEELRQIDLTMRQEVGKRLQDAIRTTIATGPPNSRLAIANMIAEMGSSVRALDVNDRAGFGRQLTTEVLQLAQDSDPAVRQQALRALGTINPDPEKAIPAFRQALKSASTEERFLAAQGLAQMMRVTNELRKRRQARVAATEKDAIQLVTELLPVAQSALRDVEPRVRIAAAESFQIAAQALTDLVYEPFSRKNFPPEGRGLVEEEIKDIVATYELVRKELVDVEPAFKAFRAATPGLLPLVSDTSTNVRLAAINALESVAWVRLKEKRRMDSVPLPSSLVPKIPPIETADPLGAFLPKGLAVTTGLLKDPDVRVRRMTVDFLENLNITAIPVIPALVEALGDSDRFVRWATARTIASLPPEKVQAAVPGLIRLLRDRDLNVRQTAAGTLEAMGDYASSAALALAHELLDGDVEERTMFMAVLVRLPADKAKVAVPQLTELLSHGDDRIRKAAAETLGKIGPLAQAAVPALRRSLGDENAEVRAAASDALLSILPRKK